MVHHKSMLLKIEYATIMPHTTSSFSLYMKVCDDVQLSKYDVYFLFSISFHVLETVYVLFLVCPMLYHNKNSNYCSIFRSAVRYPPHIYQYSGLTKLANVLGSS
jgi:hypothetical protein